MRNVRQFTFLLTLYSQYLCGTIVTIGGIIFIAGFNIGWVVAVGRLIAGLGHGIAYITTISHGAENVIKEMRGRLISSIHFIVYSTIFTLSIVMMYSYPFPGGIRTEQMVGIIAVAFSIMGVAFTPCFTYESITYLLYRNDEREALENMIKLRSESVLTWNISNDLQEMRFMVAEDRVKSKNITKDSNLRPLLLMLAISVVTALSSNLVLNTNSIEVTSQSFLGHREAINGTDPSITSIATVVLVTFRYASGIIMILFGDFFSRKKFLTLSAGLSALSLFIQHILSPYTLEYTNGVNWIPGVCAIAFQIFVGAGVEPMQHVIISEAFSTAKKYWSTAFIAVADSLIHIVIIGLSFIEEAIFLTVFIYCSIVVIALMTVILHMKLPETRGISLRQARDEFTKTRIPEGITYS